MSKRTVYARLQTALEQLPEESLCELGYLWTQRALSRVSDAVAAAHVRRNEISHRRATKAARYAVDAVSARVTPTSGGVLYTAERLSDVMDWCARVDLTGGRDSEMIGTEAGLAALQECLRDVAAEYRNATSGSTVVCSTEAVRALVQLYPGHYVWLDLEEPVDMTLQGDVEEYLGTSMGERGWVYPVVKDLIVDGDLRAEKGRLYMSDDGGDK